MSSEPESAPQGVISLSFDAVPNALQYDFYVPGEPGHDYPIPRNWLDRLLGRTRTVWITGTPVVPLFSVNAISGEMFIHTEIQNNVTVHEPDRES